MAATVIQIREILKDIRTVLYECSVGNDRSLMKRMNATMICNTSNAEVLIYILITDAKYNKTNPIKGAIYFGLPIDPNETITLPNRILKEGDCIEAYASVKDVISFVTDIENYNE